MQHLDEGTIHAWLDDALPASEAAMAEAHVAHCTECAALVAEARGLIAGASRIASSLDHVPAGIIPSAQPKPRALWNTLRLTPARARIAALLRVGVAWLCTARRAELKARHPARREGPPSLATDSAAHPRTAVSSAPAIAAPAPSKATQAQPKPKLAVKREVAESAKPAADVAAVDTVRAQRGIAGAERNFAGAPAPMASQRMVREFDASRGSPAGCYRLLSNAEHAMPIPERFALQRDSIGRNVVLRLSVDNQADSVLSGFAWRQVSPTAARLIAPMSQLLLTTDVGGRARLETEDGTTDVQLQRMPCRP